LCPMTGCQHQSGGQRSGCRCCLVTGGVCVCVCVSFIGADG
jgi:hypothetical protein